MIACGDGLPLPSNSASVPIASPDEIFGSHFCFCASLPASSSASAARYTVEENGTGALRAAHFLGDHAEFEMAGARAAKFFGDRNPEEAHLGEPLPQFLVIGRLAVQHRAHRFRRAFFGEEFPRRVAHLFLFVGEIEIHGVLLGLVLEVHRQFRGASERE